MNSITHSASPQTYYKEHNATIINDNMNKKMHEAYINLIDNLKPNNPKFLNYIKTQISDTINSKIDRENLLDTEKKQLFEKSVKALGQPDDTEITTLIENIEQYHDHSHLEKIKEQLNNHLNLMLNEETSCDTMITKLKALVDALLPRYCAN